ncbi:Glycosyl hydrolase 108 [uncultured archaeon]|nr:Glycosyl hydrolase 108 [uncultured archaeon]
MTNFQIAVQKTLAHEGGYVNNPNDRGGPTKYGITQSDMPGVDIASITPAQAVSYYSEKYWKPLYSEINDQLLGEKLFDMGVLFGVGTAVKLLQISLTEGGKISLVSDGVFGPITLADTNQRGSLEEYRTVLVRHAVDVVNRNPQDGVFLQGWLNRIAA